MSLQNTFILASFKINQDYIAKNLCVNQDKPELNCAGSCHLKENLEKANPIEDNQSTPVFEETENLVLFNSNCCERSNIYVNSKNSIFSTDEFIKYDKFIKSCFHPPQRILV